MTGTGVLALAAGAATGLGVLLVMAGVSGINLPAHARLARWPRGLTLRLAAGLAAGVVVVVVTRWVAAAIAATALVVAFDRLFGGSRRANAGIERIEALAGWTESVRDTIATGVALADALPATVTITPPALRPAALALAERLAGREPLEAALRAFAAELADPAADLVVAALILNTRSQGRELHAVLSSLARSLRSELALRRGVEAERRSTRRAVQLVVAVTVVTAVGLAVLNPAYVAPYRTVTGQLVLAVVVAIFAVGFLWLARLSGLPAPDRLIDPAPAVPAYRRWS
jgi:Flp pilus assembly protein TadB